MSYENSALHLQLQKLLNVYTQLLNIGGKNWGIGLSLSSRLSLCVSAARIPLDS